MTCWGIWFDVLNICAVWRPLCDRAICINFRSPLDDNIRASSNIPNDDLQMSSGYLFHSREGRPTSDLPIAIVNLSKSNNAPGGGRTILSAEPRARTEQRLRLMWMEAVHSARLGFHALLFSWNDAKLRESCGKVNEPSPTHMCHLLPVGGSERWWRVMKPFLR